MKLKLLAWEVTRRCPLRCQHCRAAATDAPYSNELSFEECRKVIASLGRLEQPMGIILTGGEPMYRDDITVLIRKVTEWGLRPLLATCGRNLTAQRLEAFEMQGLKACSFSLDGHSAEAHDGFRGVPGAYEMVLRAMEACRSRKMPFQINCTITRLTAPHLDTILSQAVALGAMRLDLFFLVPVGRGEALQELALSPAESEEALRTIDRLRRTSPIPIKVTCAPQSVRLWGEEGYGCLAGRGFLFLSHTGQIQPCGFLDINCGNVRDFDYDLPRAIEASEQLRALADRSNLEGACQACRYREGCGGCRARAYAATGNPLSVDPACPCA